MPYTLTGYSVATLNLPIYFNKKYILLISTIYALGGVLFGFDTAIISGIIPFIKSYFQLNEVMPGWAVSSILIGCGMGAMLAGKHVRCAGPQNGVVCLCFFVCCHRYRRSTFPIAFHVNIV